MIPLKKSLLFSLIGLCLLASCTNGAKDTKNVNEPYPNYDTSSSMEQINGQSDTIYNRNNVAPM